MCPISQTLTVQLWKIENWWSRGSPNSAFQFWFVLFLLMRLWIESMCELSNVAYISSCWSSSESRRLIVWFFRWNASTKYVWTFLASFRSSTHLIFRRIERHSWLILAIFKRENASSRFNLFYMNESKSVLWNLFQTKSSNWNKLPLGKLQSIVVFDVVLLLRYQRGVANILLSLHQTFLPTYWRLLSFFPFWCSISVKLIWNLSENFNK